MSAGVLPIVAPVVDPTASSRAADPVKGGDDGLDFGKALAGALTDAGRLEKTADDQSARFAAGDPQVGIHEVMIAVEKAAVAVRYAVTLKNRVLEAYRELMNTSL